jgi:Recombinase
MFFEDYVAGKMSLGDLQAKLNADLERFPPPESPDPRRRTGRWGRFSVWEILGNPKYTGYQVWNRRARKRDDRHHLAAKGDPSDVHCLIPGPGSADPGRPRLRPCPGPRRPG